MCRPFRHWLYTLRRVFQTCCREKESSQKCQDELPLGSLPAVYDTPTAHYERVADDYELKEGEELYEFFVKQHSLGVWRVTRRAGGKSETASEN